MLRFVRVLCQAQKGLRLPDPFTSQLVPVTTGSRPSRAPVQALPPPADRDCGSDPFLIFGPTVSIFRGSITCRRCAPRAEPNSPPPRPPRRTLTTQSGWRRTPEFPPRGLAFLSRLFCSLENESSLFSVNDPTAISPSESGPVLRRRSPEHLPHSDRLLTPRRLRLHVWPLKAVACFGSCRSLSSASVGRGSLFQP